MKTLDEALSLFKGDPQNAQEVAMPRLGLIQEIAASKDVASYLRSLLGFMHEKLEPASEKDAVTDEDLAMYQRWLINGYLHAFQIGVLVGIEMEKQELPVEAAQ